MITDRPAFTLIELLVVITIIVVLLALLTPAMDRAIREAELAVCAAQMNSLAGGLAVYTMDHRRRYPYRPPVHHPQGSYPSYYISGIAGRGPFAAADGGPLAFTDERPMLQPYLALDSFYCPPSGDASAAKSGDETWVWTAFTNLYGYKWRGVGEGPGMFKLGDRIGFDGQKFNVIVMDRIEVQKNSNWMRTAHPDNNGAGKHFQVQDADTPPDFKDSCINNCSTSVRLPT